MLPIPALSRNPTEPLLAGLLSLPRLRHSSAERLIPSIDGHVSRIACVCSCGRVRHSARGSLRVAGATGILLSGFGSPVRKIVLLRAHAFRLLRGEHLPASTASQALQRVHRSRQRRLSLRAEPAHRQCQAATSAQRVFEFLYRCKHVICCLVSFDGSESEFGAASA